MKQKKYHDKYCEQWKYWDYIFAISSNHSAFCFSASCACVCMVSWPVWSQWDTECFFRCSVATFGHLNAFLQSDSCCLSYHLWPLMFVSVNSSCPVLLCLCFSVAGSSVSANMRLQSSDCDVCVLLFIWTDPLGHTHTHTHVKPTCKLSLLHTDTTIPLFLIDTVGGLHFHGRHCDEPQKMNHLLSVNCRHVSVRLIRGLFTREMVLAGLAC